MSEYPNGNKITTKKSKSESSPNIKYHESFDLSNLFMSSGLYVENVDHIENTLHFYCKSSDSLGVCTYCGYKSKKVHSRYQRDIHDLSILGRKVLLTLEVRKFFCKNSNCSKRTFAEQPGNEIFRYRRRTRRCETAVIRQGLSVSSGMASKLLSFSGIVLSRSTILRDLHHLRPSAYKDVEEIGIDDWAWRKGLSYGTIVIDLHHKRPIDLLDNRAESSFRSWMENHNKVSLVSRDRSTEYSSAIRSIDRPIIEVADKFHLIKNMSDRFTKLIGEHYSDYRNVIRESQIVKERLMYNELKDLESSLKSERKDSRMVKFIEVKKLQLKGTRPSEIAKKLGIARQTVIKFCEMGILPERNNKHRNKYHLYSKYVENEAATGKALVKIYHEICQMGFKGSLSPFYEHYKYLSDGHKGYRAKDYKPIIKKAETRSLLVPIKLLSSMVTHSIFSKKRSLEDEQLIELLSRFTWFNQMYEASTAFYELITGNDPDALIRWMRKFWKTKVNTLKAFITGIKMDFKAVKNTIKYNITNGITEGFVNKLKVVKRVMYGRAGLDLLKRKMIMEKILFN